MIDLLLHNARITDVFRLRLFHGWVAVRGDRFLYVEEGDLPPDIEARETRDLHGAIIAPGLIDSHMHIESSLITPRRFAEAVLPWGTTAILSDPHEVGNVAGERGVRWMIAASSGLPLRVYHAIPSCIPATSPDFEWTPQVFDAEVVSRLAELPTVIALGEVMDYQGLIGASGRLQQIVSCARQRGLLIEGHIPTLQGTELSAYLAHGVTSDHTLATPKKIYEQISKGVVVMLQTKSLTEANAAAVLALPDRSRVLLVTDDFEPTLLQAGHLSRMIQLAVAVDVPPLDAWAMATVYPARYLGLRDLGAIAPGFRADFMLLADLVEFPPHEVFVDGELVAKAGSYTHSTLPEPAVQPEPVRLPGPLTARDFRLAAPLENGRMTLNTVALQTKTTTLTRLESVQIELHDGYAVMEEDDGLALIVVIARNGESKSVGLIRGTGLKSGAFASTVAHDSHNLLVIGRDVESMVTAANAVHTMSGGVAVARGDALCAQLALPYFGLLSDAPTQDVARNLAAVEACLVEQGVDLKRPFLTLSIMTLTVSPFVKFTDRGLIDTERRELLPTIINEV